MIYTLDTVTTCSSPILVNILSIMKTGLNIIQIVGPILTLIALTLNFSKLMANPDDKKSKKGLFNCLIATAILFFLPFVINLTMSIMGDNFTVSNCWNNVEEAKNNIENNQNNYISSCKCQKNALNGELTCPKGCTKCPKKCPKKAS